MEGTVYEFSIKNHGRFYGIGLLLRRIADVVSIEEDKVIDEIKNNYM